MKPKPLFITSLALFMTLMWFVLANMDYDRSRSLASIMAFNTAGWFILGLPCIAGLGIAYGAFFTLIGRGIHPICGWVAMLVLTIPAILYIAYDGLPSNRLPTIIGSEAAQVATVERLVVCESFNAGKTVSGVISGPDNLLDMIVRHGGLTPESHARLPFEALEDHSLPDYGDVYTRKGTTCVRRASVGS
jgi:hypothetical protein